MEDIFSGGILGSIFGGLFRLAPEVLKYFDRKNERAHEQKMFEQQCQLEAQRGAQKLQEIGAQHAMAVDQGVLDALKGAIDQQAEMVKAAGGWVASLSASVRPVVTYWVLFIWSFVQYLRRSHRRFRLVHSLDKSDQSDHGLLGGVSFSLGKNFGFE